LPKFWRKWSRSLLFCDGVFLGTIVGVVHVIIGGSMIISQVMVQVVTLPVSIFSWESVISRSKSSSSPVISCKPHVSCKIVPDISTTVHVTISVVPLREKWVPMVVLENDFRSYKRFLAAAGLIMR